MIKTSSSIVSDDDADGNANTCESEVSVRSFASEPANPAVPCFDLASVIVLDNDTDSDVAVITIEPLSCAIEVTVIVLSDIDELTDVAEVLLNVYTFVLFVIPSNTSISVVAPSKDTTVPSF